MTIKHRKRNKRAHPKSAGPKSTAPTAAKALSHAENTGTPPANNRRKPNNRSKTSTAKTRQRWFYDVRQYAVLTDDTGAVLLLQLPADYDAHTANTWTLPGGKLEPSDEPNNGIVREIAEETKLQPHSITPAAVARWSTRNSKKLAIFYRANINGSMPKVTLSAEHQRAIWVKPTELKDFPFHRPEMLETLQKILEK